jgi:magnesium transporter
MDGARVSAHHPSLVITSCGDPSLRGVTDVLSGLDGAQRARIADLRRHGRFFWLDVSLREAGHDRLIEALGVPEAALRVLPRSGDASASRKFHADGESVAFTLRCYVDAKARAGEAAFRLRPIEVRVVITTDYLLTLHEDPISLPAALAADLPQERSRRYVVYAVLDAMLDSTLDALEEVDLRVEGLAETWDDGGGGPVPRGALRAAGARLATMRRSATAQQPVFQRLRVEIGALPRFDTDDEPYFDRLDEQVDRLPASIDATANGMGMLLDLQLNERAYLVSFVATIFVPLTFVTGFFGMNFGWMVDHIDSPSAFWGLGIAIPVATAALSWRLLVRRFLVGDDPEARSG